MADDVDQKPILKFAQCGHALQTLTMLTESRHFSRNPFAVVPLPTCPFAASSPRPHPLCKFANIGPIILPHHTTVTVHLSLPKLPDVARYFLPIIITPAYP